MNVTLSLSAPQLQQITSALQSALQGISAQITNLQSSVDQVLKGEQQILMDLATAQKDLDTSVTGIGSAVTALSTTITNAVTAIKAALPPAEATALATDLKRREPNPGNRRANAQRSLGVISGCTGRGKRTGSESGCTVINSTSLFFAAN